MPEEKELSDEEEILLRIVKKLADYPDQVRLECGSTGNSVVVDIYIADEDFGRVLGKQGSHANALRALFSGIYGKLGKKFHLQIVDHRRGGQ